MPFAAGLLDQPRPDQAREKEGSDHQAILRVGDSEIEERRCREIVERGNSKEAQETGGYEAVHQREQQDHHEIVAGRRREPNLEEKADRSHYRQHNAAEDELRG